VSMTDNRQTQGGGHVAGAIRLTGRLVVALVSGGGTALLAAVVLIALAFAALASVFTLGLTFVAALVWLVRPLAQLERRRVHWATGATIAGSYAPLEGPLFSRARSVVTDRATWHDLAWLIVHMLVGILVAACLTLAAIGIVGLILPFLYGYASGDMHATFFLEVTSMGRALAAALIGAALLVGAWWASLGVATASTALSAWLLAPGRQAGLEARVEHLAETRAETRDDRAAELRRIERDLHDGTQALLVSLAMSLGMAEEEISRDPEAARHLIAEARATTGLALAELRSVVRGIYPPVLSERGLPAAVEALALSAGIPVDVDITIAERLPAPLESALYFAAAEALTNVARHSGAKRAAVCLDQSEDGLRLVVRDDGCGGAHPAGGSGLRGIERRVAAFDGQLSVSSPPGGPTELVIVLPFTS
jgi:signal transduction histidine kinase